MKLTLTHHKVSPRHKPFEVVERKGLGHPDTLADLLAEHLSRVFSTYTRERFGAILRHQFDKTTLMCGRCRVSFGGGELLEPIRVLINGRASARLGDSDIPVRDLLTKATMDFFAVRFPMLDPERDLRILYEVRHGDHTTTGGVFGDDTANSASIHFRFHPRTLADLPEHHRVSSNDTSLGCGYSPYTPLERFVLAVEQDLNGASRKADWPWMGSDIKIMAIRRHDSMSTVIAAPILSSFTATAADYFDRVEMIRQRVHAVAGELGTPYHIEELVVNSGDDLDARKLYMNFTGSSIESGDEGQVGRGNRIGGVIASARPFTMEGICGKNPVYHVGKVYSAAAWLIAQKLHELGGASSHVALLNRMGEPLATPWNAHVEIEGTQLPDQEIIHVVEGVLGDLASVTGDLLRGQIPVV